MAEAIEVSLDWNTLSLAYVEAAFVGHYHEAVVEHDLEWLVRRFLRHMDEGYFDEQRFFNNTYDLQRAWHWGVSWKPFLTKTSGPT